MGQTLSAAPPQGLAASNIPSAAFPLLAPDGSAAAPSYSFATAADVDTGMYLISSNFLGLSVNGTPRLGMHSTVNSTNLSAAVGIGLGATVAAADLYLSRNTAGILDLHYATTGSAQFNVWNTRTSASVGEWLQFLWTANVCVIQTSAAGGGSARSLRLRYGGLSSNAITIGTAVDAGIALSGDSSSSALSGGRVSIGGSVTATSGTHNALTFGDAPAPTATSTMDWRAINIAPTINYSNGTPGAGRVQLARFAPTLTAVPTGPSAAIVLASTASTIGGIDIFATSDETANVECLKIGYVAGNTQFELVSRILGTGTLRDIAVSMGTGTGRAKILGTANTNTTAVGNVGAGEDDLITYAMPTDSFKNAGKRVHIKAWGTTANTANAKTLKVYFGSQVVLTNALTINLAGIWRVEADVISTGTDAQDYIAQLVTTGAAGVALNDVETGTATQDDGAAITIKCTGEATSNNDIVQEGMIVEFSA